MDMKVEHHGPGAPAAGEAPAKVGETSSATRPSGSGSGTAGDQLTLSSGVRMLQQAYEQAVAQPEVRTELVARMRELDAEGQLGQDADRLADAMIDHWLTTP